MCPSTCRKELSPKSLTSNQKLGVSLNKTGTTVMRNRRCTVVSSPHLLPGFVVSFVCILVLNSLCLYDFRACIVYEANKQSAWHDQVLCVRDVITRQSSLTVLSGFFCVRVCVHNKGHKPPVLYACFPFFIFGIA